MGQNTQPLVRPIDVVRILNTHRTLWMVPAVLVMLLAGAFALTRSATWEASQAMVLRNEAANNGEGLGRFRHIEDMKLTLETMLGIAKSRGVLIAALKEVGPSADHPQPQQFPTADDVEALRASVNLTPPKGTEFGQTEILYLKVKADDRQRATVLASAICRHLQEGLRHLRQSKAQSMIDELTKAAELAGDDLQQATSRLAGIEQEVGSDLGELRMLDMSATGDSDLRRMLASIENELRETRTAATATEELLDLLQAAQKDPGYLLATPNRLLESQPALRRLKEGLIDAQLQTARVLSTMTELHPLAIAARSAQKEIGERLHGELSIAVRGVELDRRLTADRLKTLETQQAELRGRLDRLASRRAEYSRVAADVRHRTTLLEKAQQDLAEARASQAAAHTASLITLVDGPEAGNRPLGPSLATILLCGLLGGLFTGFGLVFLTADVQATPNGAPQRRAADRINGTHWVPASLDGLELNMDRRRN